MSSNKWLYLAAAALLSLSTNMALAQGQGHGYGHDKDKHDRDEDRRDDKRGDKREAKEDRHYYRDHDRELHEWYQGHRELDGTDCAAATTHRTAITTIVRRHRLISCALFLSACFMGPSGQSRTSNRRFLLHTDCLLHTRSQRLVTVLLPIPENG